MPARTTKPDIKGFPQDNVPPEEKETKAWLIQYCRAIFDRRRYSVGSYDQDDKQFIINRKYAEGMQSTDKYKNRLNIREGDVSYLNLDFSIVDIIGKFIDLWVGEMLDKDSEIRVSSIDRHSKSDKDKAYNKYKANLELREESIELERLTGQPLIPKGEYIPESKQEIDLHMQLNYKHETEIATELLVEQEFYRNDYKADQEEMHIRDLGVIKRLSAKIDFDDNNMVRLRIVDWANLYLPYGVREDLSDCRYIAEVIKIPVHELRRLSNGKLSEEEIFNIAKINAGQYGNRAWEFGDAFHKYYDRNEIIYTEYDDFLIAMLDTSIISTNTDIFVKKPHTLGSGFWFEKKAWDYEMPPEVEGRKREILKKDMQYVYKATWVIGSDHLLNYGLAEDIIHATQDGKITPATFHPYILLAPQQRDMENKSMLERMIPHGDAIQLIFLKIQALLAKVRPPGIAVDVQALKDVILGSDKKEWTPLQIQDLYDQTGNMYYMGSDDDGTPMNRKPIEPLSPDMGVILEQLIGLYNFHIQQMRNVTGINEQRDASTVDKDVPVATAKMGLIASRNATKSLDKAYRTFKAKIGKRVALMIQYNIARGRNLDYYNNIIGKQGVKAISFAKKMKLVEFGIKVEALPTMEEQQIMEGNIQMALGKDLIRLEDSIMIRAIKNTKLASQYLIHKTGVRAKQKLQESQILIQTQTQETAKAELQKEAAKQKTIMLEASEEMKLLLAKYDLEDRNDKSQHERKLIELEKSGEIKSGHIEEAAEADLKNTDLTKGVPQPSVATGVGVSKPSVAA